jgi:hypothetical protein
MNPIFQRYCRSRLRPQSLIFWILLTLIGTSFVFFFPLVFTLTVHNDMTLAARTTLLPLIVVQAIILMLFGTGAVAGGITQERVDKILDYQRMAPLPTTRKIFGYLFGLPVREYLMFALTLPFLAFAIWAGQVPIFNILAFYLIFLSSAVLYHMTGFAAGMVSPKWRLSARISQGLVIVLYLIIPPLTSAVGIIYFEFLTFRPALVKMILPLVEGLNVGSTIREIPLEVPFFQLSVSTTLFSLFVQAIFFLILFHVIYRKWHRPFGTSLSKIVALACLLVVIFVGIANLWPTFTNPAGFGGNGPTPDELIVRQIALLTLALLTGVIVLLVSAPEPLTYRQGWIRCRKLGERAMSPFNNASPAHWVSLSAGFILGLLSLLIYLIPPEPRTEIYAVKPNLPLLAGGFATLAFFQVQAAKELFGLKGTMVWVLIVWVTPILVALISAAAAQQDSFVSIAYILTLSPAGLFPLLFISSIETTYSYFVIHRESFETAMVAGFAILGCSVLFLQLRLFRLQKAAREQE